MNVERRYYTDGSLKEISCIENGEIHREDGPAVICYYKNGNIRTIYYFKKGKIHREDGPAKICYYENGNIQKVYYYINNEELNEFQVDIFLASLKQ